jgi:hypothetical protein
MSASYPTSAKSFTTKTNTTTADASHVNDLQDEVTAIENDLLGPLPTARGGTSVNIATTALPLAGGQITFPAAQNASADANTLDDYEEGTWTPVIGGSGGTSGQTYSAQVAHYIKIGKLVIASFDVAVSNKGTITTDVQIQGLPFTSLNSGAAVGFASCVAYFGDLSTNWIALSLAVVPNSTAATVYGRQSAGAAVSTLATADISNTTRLTGTAVYLAAS